MELYQLENLIAVVEEHSFTRAAERVFRTQAAVSVAIRKLEEALGARLIDRDSNDCTLTEAGELALKYARRIVELRNEMQGALAEFTALGSGSVGIAAHESAARYLLPDPMAAFHKSFPEIRISTRLCDIEEVAHLVADRVVDLGFGVRPRQTRGVHAQRILTDPLVLVTAPDHPLTQRQGVQVIDLEQERFFTHHLHTRTIDAIQELFESKHASFKVVAELWNFETIKTFVKGGSGIAILPLSVAQADVREGSLAIVPLEEMNIEREIEVLFRDRDKLQPAALELLRTLSTWSWSVHPTGSVPREMPPPALDVDDGARRREAVGPARVARLSRPGGRSGRHD